MERKIGDIVVFKTHPYLDNNTDVKITAYAEYTPPLLVVKEIKEKSFNKETGVNISQQLNCIYYNSRDGKFVEKWINNDLINSISKEKYSTVKSKILQDIDLKKSLEKINLDNDTKGYDKLIRNNFLHRKVVLKSVDLELLKIKVNRTKENGDLVETNHLEFLPPVMTIIGHRWVDEKNKFCDKTGLPLVELKCKWYNSSSKSFSESFFSYGILYLVKEIQYLLPDRDLLSEINESIEENSFYNFSISKPFELEGNPDVTISRTIGFPLSITFKHYYYQVNYSNYITQKKSVTTIDQNFNKISQNSIFGIKYPNYIKGYKSNVFDCQFKRNKYYLITYQDSYNRKTNRIIKVEDLLIYIKNIDVFEESYKTSLNVDENKDSVFETYGYHDNGKIYLSGNNENIKNNIIDKSIFSDSNVEIYLHANCLLRKGKYRNFKINNILEAEEIKEGEVLFEATKENNTE
ncbi:hypothetical protein ABS768_04425 [Flavobacterium sp. ST-75]|uniref:Uncharacterized protein n=1 Tax=Flavobacterium rhizophilum TaxID=3163296 RepID=A0ABW8YBQ9_9FLAO